MYWIYFSEISSPSTLMGFFLAEPTPSSRHICHLHLSVIPGAEGKAMLCLLGSWTTVESWFNSQNALGCLLCSLRAGSGGSLQLVLGANWLARNSYQFHRDWKRQTRGVIPPLRHTSSGNGLK